MGQEQSITPHSGASSTATAQRKSWWRRSARESVRVPPTESFVLPEDVKGRETRIIKIVVLGDTGAGKSSIVERYCLGLYNIQHVPTVGPQLTSCELTPERVESVGSYSHDIRAQFVELPAQETYEGSPTFAQHLGDADGVLFAVDATRAASALFFDALLPRAKAACRGDCLFALFLHKNDRKTPKMPLRRKGAEVEYAAAAGLCHVAATTSVLSKGVDANVGVLLSKILIEGRGPDAALASRVARPEMTSQQIGTSTLAEVGNVDDERIRLVESHIAAFLNVHIQVLGDYKKQHAATVSTGRPSLNHKRVEVGSTLEVELQRECERLLTRLKKLRANVPLTAVPDLREFLAITAHFYCKLMPCWGDLPNELFVESALAHARGQARAKSGPVLKSANQYTAAVPPPAAFGSYLQGAGERRAREDTKDITHRVSPDTTIVGSLSSNPVGGSTADSWEGSGVMAPNSGGRAMSGDYPMGLGLTPRKENSPPGYPNTFLGMDRGRNGVSGVGQADRHLLKVLSQNKADLKQLKDFLSYSNRNTGKLRHRSVSSTVAGSATRSGSRQQGRSRRNSHGHSQHSVHIQDEDIQSRRSTLGITSFPIFLNPIEPMVLIRNPPFFSVCVPEA